MNSLYQEAIYRKSKETYYDYLSRLFENKSHYKLDCTAIANLMNLAFGKQCGESKYRKEWKAFYAGRQYERGKLESGIARSILSCSDFHFPFALPVETFADYSGRVDILQLNGDLVDQQAISKYPKAYRISPMEEIIGARQYFISLIELIRPKQIVITYGNHCLRFQDYLAKHIDSDLMELMPKTSLELIFADGFYHYNKRERTKVWHEPLCRVFPDIEVNYTGNWFCQIGDTIFCHPIAFNSGPLKTAEKALYWFRNEGNRFAHMVLGHTHRIGSYVIGNSMIYEQGCCCDIDRINYNNGKLVNSQKEGFLYLCQDKNGDTLKENTKQIILN